ncbi:MAG: hypothetical protein QM770_12320 [Tepidisphaeraceae bacterium]
MWSKSTIVDSSADVGYYASIAVDRSGKAAISYYDNTNSGLKYAQFDGASWSNQNIDIKKAVGTHTSLGFDAFGNAYIAYYKKSGGQLKLATQARDANTWGLEIVESGGAGERASIAVSQGKIGTNSFNFSVYTPTVAIAYANETTGAIQYARHFLSTGETWNIFNVTTLAPGTVGPIDFKLHFGPTSDSTTPSQAQLVFQDASSADVMYAYKNGTTATGSFVVETVASTGKLGDRVQLGFDSSNRPAVTYYNRTKKAFYGALRSAGANGTWSIQGQIATGAGPLSLAFNDRTSDSLTTWLNRPKDAVYSAVLI